MSGMTFLYLAAIGAAGALGAISRYMIGRYIAKRAPTPLPWGTLLINVTGAFLIGLIFSLAGRALIPPTWQTIGATGFLGGYTTFSTMSWEGVQLVRAGSARASILYLGGNLFLGLLAVSLGLLLGRWL